MSILGFIANFWWALAFFVLAIGCFVWFLIALFGSFDRNNRDAGRLAQAIIAVVATLFFVMMWYFSATHAVVPMYTSAVVVDKTTSKIVGNVREPGLLEVPLLGSAVYYYPAATNAERCEDFTPSVKGGYEVSLKLCFYLNADKVDWPNQISRYNRPDWDNLWAAWANQLAPLVAKGIKDSPPQDLTNKRDTVSDSIKSNVAGFFETEKVPLNSLSLRNWKFTNPDMQKEFDKTLIAQTQSATEQAGLDAAVIARQRELYVADTDVQKANKMAEGQRTAMKTLGISSEDGVIHWLTIQWLLGNKNAQSIIIDTTSGGVKPAVPATK